MKQLGGKAFRMTAFEVVFDSPAIESWGAAVDRQFFVI